MGRATLATTSSLSAAVPRRWWAPVALLALLAAHLYRLSLPWDQPNPLALPANLFSLAMLAGLLWLGAALGLRLLRLLGLGGTLGLETALFAVGLGLGGLAYLALGLGLFSLLLPGALALLLACLAVVLRGELAEVAAAVPTARAAWLAELARLRVEGALRLAVPLAAVMLLLTLLQALAPPTGYDALLYHLAAPREFLRLGQVVPLPDLQQANMPFTVEMLYLYGLAFGSDSLPSLLHLAFAVLLALATFAFGRRLLGPRVGWLAAAILLSSSAVPIYARMANVDFGWAFFDFLAIYAVATWAAHPPEADEAARRSPEAGWLIVAGLAGGLSLGSKYFGALTCGALGLAILVRAARTGGLSPARLARPLLLFSLPAALVAAPWYLKSWLWLGSPVWPFLASRELVESSLYFGSQMHRGRELLDHVLLPLRLYQGELVEVPAALPPLLFLVVPGYLLVRKRPLVTALLGLAALHFAVWTQGIQTLRYLVPVFPALSLAAAYVLDRAVVGPRTAVPARIVVPALVLLALLVSLGAASLSFFMGGPPLQLVGLESRQAYLSRALPDFPAIQYLNEHRAEVGRVLLVGDARVYYLEPPALADQGLDVLRAVVAQDNPRQSADLLRQRGITHVLVSPAQLTWLVRFDPEQRVRQAWEAFERGREGYLVPEFSNQSATVYRVAGPPVDASPERSRP